MFDAIRPEVRAMRGYEVAPAAGIVKLDAMENPFRLSPELQTELGAQLGALPLNRYPAACYVQAADAVSEHADIPENCSVLLGNGSDELIAMLSICCGGRNAKLLAPVPSFVMYETLAKLHGLSFIGVPLTLNFELDEAAMLSAIEQHRPALTFVAYPNNPTGNLFDDAVIRRVINLVHAQGHGLVVLDEAYHPFASRTWMQRFAQDPQVLVMRTLSKFGLAGVRLGYLVGAKALVQEIDKVRLPYNISVLNAQATMFALAHADEFARQAQVLCQERQRLQKRLGALLNVTRFHSDANMILVRVPDSAAAFEGMKSRGVLVKHVATMHPLLRNCLRVTVGTPEENNQMLEALKASL